MTHHPPPTSSLQPQTFDHAPMMRYANTGNPFGAAAYKILPLPSSDFPLLTSNHVLPSHDAHTSSLPSALLPQANKNACPIGTSAFFIL